MGVLDWPEQQPVLEGGEFSLRAWSPGDADAVFEACQDPSIQRWTTVPSPYSPEHAAGYVDEFARQQWRGRQGAPFCIAASSTGRVVGACGLVTVDAGELVAEVGYWVAAPERGFGAAESAVKLLAEWAFAAGGMRRLEFYIEPANSGSVRVAERVGCAREGLLRSKAVIRGERRDMLLYALVG